MNLVIENSSLSNLSPVFAGDLMILWADDLDSAKLILKSTKKHRWLILLGIFRECKKIFLLDFFQGILAFIFSLFS